MLATSCQTKSRNLPFRDHVPRELGSATSSPSSAEDAEHFLDGLRKAGLPE
jgi:hypothetical protein